MSMYVYTVWSNTKSSWDTEQMCRCRGATYLNLRTSLESRACCLQVRDLDLCAYS